MILASFCCGRYGQIQNIGLSFYELTGLCCFQSSRSILVQFSIRCLSGEGDVTKHLGHLGYKLPHMQSILDEFDYSVSNLATSLRDGLRLA